jgi:hypothetical protein
MRWWLLAVLILVAIPLLTVAQAPRVVQAPQLEIPSFAGLQAKATRSVDVTIGSTELSLVSSFMSDSDPDSAQLKKAFSGLKSVHVRNYQFDSDNAYSKADIEGVRAQLKAPGWSSLVHATDKSKDEDVDVYVSIEDHTVNGLAVVASNPREFTIVNIVGTLDLKALGKVQKHLGLPGPALGRNLAYDM